MADDETFEEEVERRYQEYLADVVAARRRGLLAVTAMSREEFAAKVARERREAQDARIRDLTERELEQRVAEAEKQEERKAGGRPRSEYPMSAYRTVERLLREVPPPSLKQIAAEAEISVYAVRRLRDVLNEREPPVVTNESSGTFRFPKRPRAR